MESLQNAINLTIGRRLKMACQWRNLQLEQLAAKSGLTPTMLAKYEAGQSAIYADKLMEISFILDLPIDYFCELPETDGEGSV